MTFKKKAICDNCGSMFPVKKDQYIYSKQLEYNPNKKGKFDVLYELWELFCPDCHRPLDRIIIAG